MIRRSAGYALLLCVFILSEQTVGYGADLTVAVLKSEGNFPVEDILTGFKMEMQENSIAIRLTHVEGGNDFDNIFSQITRVKPDMLICVGVKALEQAARIKNIPVLYSMVTQENARPWSAREGILGISLDIAPLLQFRIMRQAMPSSKRIGVFYDPDHNQKLIDEAKKAAAETGFSLVALPVRTIREIPSALENLEHRVDILWTIYDPSAYTPESTRYILLQALRKKIPVVGLSPHFAKAGALLAIYGDYTDMGRQLALQAIVLSKRGEPAPRIWRPRKARIAINEKVGRMMDIDFSSQFLKTVHQTY
ncbi:MAG: hypothetical protein K4571_03690 [Deltaproteobacteria bacterium]